MLYTPWFRFLFCLVVLVLTPFSVPSFSPSVFISLRSFISSWCIYLLLFHFPWPPIFLYPTLYFLFLTPLPDPFIHLCRIPSWSIFPSLRFRSLTDSQSRFLTLEGESDEASGQLPDFFAKISEENGGDAAEDRGRSAENDEFANFGGGWIKAPPHFKYTREIRGWIDWTNL